MVPQLKEVKEGQFIAAVSRKNKVPESTLSVQ